MSSAQPIRMARRGLGLDRLASLGPVVRRAVRRRGAFLPWRGLDDSAPRRQARSTLKLARIDRAPPPVPRYPA